MRNVLAVCLACWSSDAASTSILMLSLPVLGEVISVLHRACSYARVLEAAQKGYGYTSADMASYAGMLTKQVDRCARLLPLTVSTLA